MSFIDKIFNLFDKGSEDPADVYLSTRDLPEAKLTREFPTPSIELSYGDKHFREKGLGLPELPKIDLIRYNGGPRNKMPVKAATGDLFHNTDTNEVFIYNGKSWLQLESAIV